MKKALFLTLLLYTGAIRAQGLLTNSRTTSVYTYLYKLDDQAMHLYYTGQSDKLKDKLGIPVDSFRTDRPNTLKPPPGNYIQVYAKENKLQYRLIEKHTAGLKILNDLKLLRFVLLDSADNEISTAKAIINGKAISYDDKLRSYQYKTSRHDTLLQVYYAGATNFYKIKPVPYPPEVKPSWLKRFWAAVSGIFRSSPKKPVAAYRFIQPEANPGYIVFNKPKYKPGDTVKLKAFILQKGNYKPIPDQQLAVKLSSRYTDDGKILDIVRAYRPGGFVFDLKLTDSLKLRLDNSYYISLVPFIKPKDKNLKTPSPDYYQRDAFRYEDYELNSLKFNARADKREHGPGDPLSLYLRATDDNGLDATDGRVIITLLTQNAVGLEDHVYVPDTLWRHEMKLDPVGETKVMIPDSVFPRAQITYSAQVVLLNSNNERREQNLYATYTGLNEQLTSAVTDDSIKLDHLVSGKSQPAPATLFQVNENNDTVRIQTINLPAQIPINTAIALYTIKAGNLSHTADLRSQPDMLAVSGHRRADSLFLKVNNPRRLKFWYTLTKGNQIASRGSSETLPKQLRAGFANTITLQYNYIWAGRMLSREVTFPYRDKYLDIDVSQPVAVYPGQQSTINIKVKDATGKPVPGVDLTAYALTSKFENYRTVAPRYLGKLYPGAEYTRPLINQRLPTVGTLQFDWQRWSKQMGLDSIEYYKFTHPKEVYRIEEKTPDGATQLAPFALRHGGILPVHVVYIDNAPVYFSQTSDVQQYSFGVKPGRHDVRLRTADQMITLIDVMVAAGKKLILAINTDTLQNKQASFVAMPDTLTKYEADLINKYLITIAPNFGDRVATLSQGNRLFMFGNGFNYGAQGTLDYLIRRTGVYTNRNNSLLAGPVINNALSFQVNGQPQVDFMGEPGYTFQFEPGLIKQRSLPVKYPFAKQLALIPGDIDYRQYALTYTAIDSLRQNYLDERSRNNWYSNNNTPHQNNGRLTIRLTPALNTAASFVKSIIVYKSEEPDFVRIYGGRNTDLGNFEPGGYRIVYLLKGNKYLLQENVQVKARGNNLYNTAGLIIHPADSMSKAIGHIIDEQNTYQYTREAVQQIKELFNDKYLFDDLLKDEMSGYVYDAKDKLPVIGASVKIKGTNKGANADLNGHFKLQVPKKGTLVVTTIGYLRQEVTLHPGKAVNIYLEPSTNVLNEVTVSGGFARDNGTGLKIDVREDTTRYSASAYKIRELDMALQGRLPGVNVSPDGNLTVKGKQITKIRLNGKDFAGSDVNAVLKNLPAEVIESAQMIDDYGDQTNMAGSRNGDPEKILNITVSKSFVLGLNDPALLGLQSIRKNFSDYAFWQPKLITDAQGNASFKAIFPDDITSWRTFVIGMNGNRQTGAAEGLIRSYKPLSANFAPPQFAVKGDVLSPIGKVLNYTADTIRLKRTFKLNGELFDEKDITLKNSVIDTFKITAAGKDSLNFEYTIRQANGYFDGEKRSIPLFEQGSLETKGMFAALNSDTTITLTLDPKLKEGTFRAEASLLPVLLDETQRLRDYEYLCNEQLASKLIGLLAEKKIRGYLKQPFKYDANINAAIKQLHDNRRSQGTWGWWKDTDEELWISLHAATALLQAEAQGFKTKLDKQRLIEYLLYQAEAYKGDDKLTVLLLLQKLGAKADYEELIKNYQRWLASKSIPQLYDRLRLILVQQQAGLPIAEDSLLKLEHHTMFGNVYWGEENYNFFDNSVQESLLVYQILKANGRHPELLYGLRNYFLEQRKDGQWRNTYESAQVLENIVPDLLIDGETPKPSAIILSGDRNESVTKFPYTAKLSGGAALTVKKTGTLPVYITAYQQALNPSPDKVNKDFTVDTRFEKDGRQTMQAIGGETIRLQTEVTARADADYVMLEIPIPAGCSYKDKDQAYGNGEVHREYFKNKVCIFCRKLTQGKHSFSISLTARYNGVYHVNPAKAEMMYFPVFYGREAMKTFTIGK